MGMAVTESIAIVLCALETSLYPHTVLRKREAAHVCAPVRLRFGGGAAHVNLRRPLPYVSEPERMSNQSEGLRVNGLCAPLRARRRTCVMTEHYPEAHPMVVQ